MSKKKTPLGEIDADYKCTIIPAPSKSMVPVKWTMDIKGRHVSIPSRHLFITEDGKVFVVVKRRGNVRDYASLDGLIAVVKKTEFIEGFQTP